MIICNGNKLISTAKPHINGKTVNEKSHHRSRREEILPQQGFYNPGSEEVARLSFEDQNSESQNRYFSNGNSAPSESDAMLEGYRDNTIVEKELASSNYKEAADIQKDFLAQSEVQKSSVGTFPQDNGTPASLTEEIQSYENAESSKPDSSKMEHNPFEMPAGYPDQDGYKKSIVTKQNLPFNGSHPGGNHLTNFSTVLCIFTIVSLSGHIFFFFFFFFFSGLC